MPPKRIFTLHIPERLDPRKIPEISASVQNKLASLGVDAEVLVFDEGWTLTELCEQKTFEPIPIELFEELPADGRSS